MSRPSVRPLKTLLVIATVVGTVLIGTPTAGATVPLNRFTIAVTPTTVGAGSASSFAVTVKNQSPIGWLDSLDLKVPTPLVVTGASTSRGVLSRTGNVVKLRHLLLLPGRSFGLTVNATAPCSPSGSFLWTATGKGILGLTFSLNTAASSRTTAIAGPCSLSFVTQPADAHPDDVITGSPFDTGGPAISVQVLDGLGDPTAAVSTSIGMDLQDNPGGGTLSGITSVATTDGAADFADLSIDQPSPGYTLRASASGAGITSATSDPFEISGLSVQCVPDVDCTGTLSDEDSPTTGTVNALADPSGPTLTMSFVSDGLDCEDYEEQSGTLEFNVTSTRTKEVTISFDTDLDAYHLDPTVFQVCFQSDTPFTDRFDNEGVTLGLLPDCYPDYYSLYHHDDEAVPPCVLSRTEDGSIVHITFLAPAGDPRGRV